VYGFSTGYIGSADDGWHVQITFGGCWRANADGLVCQPNMLQVSVCCGIHGHRLNAKVTAASHDAQGNFATVGDENFLDRGYHRLWPA